MAGIVAAIPGLTWAIHAAGLFTLLSGIIAWRFMKETLEIKPVTNTLREKDPGNNNNMDKDKISDQ